MTARQEDGIFGQPSQPTKQAAETSFAHSLKIVAWGLLGVRKGHAHRADAARITPFHIVLAALLALLALVGGLVVVVRWVSVGV